jgi:hypothetical protein
LNQELQTRVAEALAPPSPSSNYRALQPEKIVQTLHRLQARISERFPGSGLSKVSSDLAAVAETTSERVARLAKPYFWLRLGVWMIIVTGVIAQIFAARYLRVESVTTDLPGLVQGLEAAVNLLILFGAAVWFLMTLEERWKRGRILKALHELRSLAHVVDMHQLTKDPTMALLGGSATASSPRREMTRFQLARYLDYCAELLALIGKLAALYAERSRDALIIEAVNDLELLTTELGRKTWQKIIILGQLQE